VEKSQEQIRDFLVNRLHADQYGVAYNQGQEVVIFRLLNVPHRFSIPPAKSEQERRRLWRCVYLHVKSLWETIQNGILTTERAFLLYTLLPNGKTVEECLPNEIKIALSQGQMPQLMPFTKKGNE